MRLRWKEVSPLTERALNKLQRLIDLRQHQPGNILADSEVPESLDRYKPGNTYGAHRETIIRREVRREGTPKWFDPISIPGHFGIITDDGYRCYIEVEVDVDARNLPSTFETRLRELVEDEPDQIALLL